MSIINVGYDINGRILSADILLGKPGGLMTSGHWRRGLRS